MTEFETTIGNSTRAVSDKWKVSEVLQYPSVITRTFFEEEKTFYIINFKEGGFAVVPSDKRATDVYAFSTEGYFDVEKNESLRCFMSLATDYLNEDMVLQPRELKPIPGPDDYLIDWYGGEKCYAKSTVSTTRPFYLLNTKWHQHEPYRMFCFTTSGEDAAAGCVAIAMAQIMAYHKKPLSYNNHTYLWEEMLQYSYVPYGGDAAKCVAYLVNDIGKVVKMHYDTFERGGSFSNISNAFIGFKAFGYLADLPQSYDSNKVLQSLVASRPVLVRATQSNSTEGHEWVIDGYYQENTSVDYYSVETLQYRGSNFFSRKYVHCNWGWISDGNGYFLEGVYNVDGNSLNKDISIMSNIY